MRYGKPKYWFDAKIGIRIERGEEKDTSPCLTATANYSSDLVEAKAGVAEESSQAGCPDAMGSSMFMLFWFLEVWGSRGP